MPKNYVDLTTGEGLHQWSTVLVDGREIRYDSCDPQSILQAVRHVLHTPEGASVVERAQNVMDYAVSQGLLR